MVRHVHGFCVIEVLRGDRLGEMVVRRRSGVHGLERREGLIEIRGVETVRGLVGGGGPKVHYKGREGGGSEGGGRDGGGSSGQRRDLKLFARMGDVEQMGDRASGVAAVTSRSDHIQRSGRTKGNERIRTSSALETKRFKLYQVNAVTPLVSNPKLRSAWHRPFQP